MMSRIYRKVDLTSSVEGYRNISQKHPLSHFWAYGMKNQSSLSIGEIKKLAESRLADYSESPDYAKMVRFLTRDIASDMEIPLSIVDVTVYRVSNRDELAIAQSLGKFPLHILVDAELDPLRRDVDALIDAGKILTLFVLAETESAWDLARHSNTVPVFVVKDADGACEIAQLFHRSPFQALKNALNANNVYHEFLAGRPS